MSTLGAVLYLDCSSGIAGDMAVASLIDLGADRSLLDRVLSGLDDDFDIRITEVSRNGIRACDFDVIIDGNRDHDMDYLHGHCGHGEHHRNHGHRNLGDVLSIIGKLDMTDSARLLSEKIFRIVAEAESEVHGTSIDEVLFHEVGALDSIVDIVSFSVLFDSMGFSDVIITGIGDGHGMIRCQHGMIPIPVPAASEIVMKHGIPVVPVDVEGELMTPTGAAIAAAIRTRDRLPPEYRIVSRGSGAGKRDYPVSGILRAFVIEEPVLERDAVIKLETSIDDCSGECLGFTMERLFAEGAKDASYSPIYMKKNRPAYRLEVLCDPDDVARMEDVIFSNTTSIGIRRCVMERDMLPRRVVSIDTCYGRADVKVCRIGSEERPYPEYESAASIARSQGIGYMEAYDLILDAYDRTQM